MKDFGRFTCLIVGLITPLFIFCMYDNHFKSEPQSAAMTSVYIVLLQAAKGAILLKLKDISRKFLCNGKQWPHVVHSQNFAQVQAKKSQLNLQQVRTHICQETYCKFLFVAHIFISSLQS